MRGLRLSLEIIGSVVLLAFHYPLAWLYVLAAADGGRRGLLTAGIAATGYLAMLAFATLSGRAFGSLSRRSRFDAWLGAFPIAIPLVALLIAILWPLHGVSWDAHGFGMRGGEPNVVFTPWLHGLVWVAILLRLRKGRST